MSAKPNTPVTLLVGAGRMGGALLKGWISQRIGRIAVVETVPSRALEVLADKHRIRLLGRIEDTLNQPVGACVIALKPQVLRNEAHHLEPVARSGALMISIAAGTSIAALRKAWGRQAHIIRAMPNLPGSIGRGISALYAPRDTGESYRVRAETLLTGLGATFWVNRETLIDSVTAVSGSGPAYVFLFAECLAQAARVQGIPPRIAEQLARATVSGAGALLDFDSKSAGELRRDVTSPGGTTEAALEVLVRNKALANLIAESVAAARNRAEELRRQSEV